MLTLPRILSFYLQAIESLAEKDYIERVNDSRDTWQYVA
jgi:hypothetical protein